MCVALGGITPVRTDRGEVFPLEPAGPLALVYGPAVGPQLTAPDAVVTALVGVDEAADHGRAAGQLARVEDNDALRTGCSAYAFEVSVKDGTGAAALLGVRGGSPDQCGQGDRE